MSMQISNNTLKAVKDYFINQLSRIHGQGEAESMFVLACYYLLGYNRAQIRLNEDLKLSESEMLKFIDLNKKIRQGEPFQYAIGFASFMDLELIVNTNVLIPKPETEELVQWVTSVAKKQVAQTIWDIGTGSGCIALALKNNLPTWKICGFDKSSDALEVAKMNAQKLQLTVQFSELDVLAAYPDKEDGLQIIVSNPPYIGKEEATQMESHVLDFEPSMALFPDGENVFIFYERLAKLAQENNALLFVEINSAYGNEVTALFGTFGAKEIELRKDLSGNNRMIKASWLRD